MTGAVSVDVLVHKHGPLLAVAAHGDVTIVFSRWLLFATTATRMALIRRKFAADMFVAVWVEDQSSAMSQALVPAAVAFTQQFTICDPPEAAMPYCAFMATILPARGRMLAAKVVGEVAALQGVTGGVPFMRLNRVNEPQLIWVLIVSSHLPHVKDVALGGDAIT